MQYALAPLFHSATGRGFGKMLRSNVSEPAGRRLSHRRILAIAGSTWSVSIGLIFLTHYLDAPWWADILAFGGSSLLLLGLVIMTVRFARQREQAEAARAASDAQYRDLYEHAPIGYCELDAAGRIVRMNHVGLQMLGYSTDEMVGRPIFDFVLEAAEARRVFEAKIRGEIPSENVNERRMLRKDGSLLPALLSGRHLYDAAGKVVGMRTVMQDISKLRCAERALEQLEQKLGAIFDAIAEGVVVIDPEGIIIKANATFAQFSGRANKAELIGKRMLELLHPTSREYVTQQILPRLRAERALKTECQLTTDAGKPLDVEISLIKLNGEDDKPAELMAIVRDMTERRRIEQEMAKVQKLESIGVLAGGIAHDFNNLLTSILGHITLAKMSVSKSDDAFEDLCAAENACMRARDLTQQLLTFARGGAPAKTAASIANLIRETATFVARGSNVRCDVDLPADLWPVEVDSGQISQVIQNLVMNAQEAMPAGGTIEVAARNFVAPAEAYAPLQPGRRYVRISVHDHGAGIPENLLPRIFDPYFSTKENGRGLGLATAYSIVRQHDGHITAKSQPGMGTEFRVYLPASDKQPAQQGAPASENRSAKRARVLVVDDEESVRDVALSMLRRLGHQARGAGDSRQGLELYRKMREVGTPFDVVIMDLTMPGSMGGIEATRELHQLDPQVRVIVSSGYSDDAALSRPSEYGFVGVVRKPYRVEDLQRTLSAALYRDNGSANNTLAKPAA
jgi:PAS domain S-box-containing protein